MPVTTTRFSSIVLFSLPTLTPLPSYAVVRKRETLLHTVRCGILICFVLLKCFHSAACRGKNRCVLYRLSFSVYTYPLARYLHGTIR